jgi:hypothetical protein
LTDLQEGIRRRFSNAYHWYCVLLLSSRKHLQEALEDARSQYGNPWCEEDAGDDVERVGMTQNVWGMMGNVWGMMGNI